MSEKLGHEMVLKYGAAGTTSGNTTVNTVRDLDLDMDATEVDATSRDNAGWKKTRSGLRSWRVSFEMLYDPANTAWEAIRTAYFAGTSIGCSVLDGSAGEGVSGAVYVTSFGRGEPLDDMVTTAVTFTGAGVASWG